MNAMSLPKKLKREAFASLKKEGIFKTIQDQNAKFHRQRAAAKALVVCGGCKGFLSSINHNIFSLHSEQFRKDILSTRR